MKVLAQAVAAVIVVACGRAPRSDSGGGEASPRPVADGGATDARAVAAPPRDAVPPAPTDANQALEDALGGLWSEHPDQDVRPLEWWRANAAVARPRLAAMLSDGKDDGQGDYWAIRILADLGDAADVPVLRAVVETWGELSKNHAAVALAAHATPAAGDALVELTASADDEIAAAAALGLASRAEETNRTRLEELLDHRDASVRYQAARGLSEIGGASSKAALRRRKKVEKDRDVRAMIVTALTSKK